MDYQKKKKVQFCVGRQQCAWKESGRFNSLHVSLVNRSRDWIIQLYVKIKTIFPSKDSPHPSPDNMNWPLTPMEQFACVPHLITAVWLPVEYWWWVLTIPHQSGESVRAWAGRRGLISREVAASQALAAVLLEGDFVLLATYLDHLWSLPGAPPFINVVQPQGIVIQTEC